MPPIGRKIRTEGTPTALLRTYERTVYWGRLSVAAFYAVYVCIILWAFPWFPFGLSTADYSQQNTTILVLFLLASASAFLALILRDRKRRLEQTLLTWTTVHDGLSDLRQREYFYDRVVIEAERARARKGEFTIAVVRLGDEGARDGARRLRLALEALEPMIDQFDCLASFGREELGILAPEINGARAAKFTADLRHLIATALEGEAGEIASAYAVYGTDLTDPSELVALARARLLIDAPADVAGSEARPSERPHAA